MGVNLFVSCQTASPPVPLDLKSFDEISFRTFYDKKNALILLLQRGALKIGDI